MAALLNTRRIGLMCQPMSNLPKSGWVWAADNGCFSEKWDEARWLAWLDKDLPRAGCLFAVVPDVVADHEATVERFDVWHDVVRSRRYPVAFVGQDGADVATVPWDRMDAFFVGGSTEWKMSHHAFDLAHEAKARGKWVHVGRVNSQRRYCRWADHADSCDGTFLAFGPKKNAVRLTGWLDHHEANPSLWGVS